MTAWTRRGLIAAGLTAATVPSTVFASPTGPALWSVSTAHAKVFLFGDNPCQHSPWRSARIEGALNESAVLWKETPDAGPGTTSLFFAKGVDPARPLSTWLTPDQRMRVSAAATGVNLGDAALERFRPWLAAVFLEDGFNSRAGFKPEYGPTGDLTARAKAAGKPIRTEFPDEAAIVDYFASFSSAAEVGALLRAVDDIEAGAEAADRNAHAWAAGDQRPDLADVLRWRQAYPAYYQRILVERNGRWVLRVRAMLDGGGTTFVLVGGAHLVGPDSVQRQLATAGLEAVRV